MGQLRRKLGTIMRRVVDPVDHQAFVREFFPEGAYEDFVEQFDAGRGPKIVRAARSQYLELTESGEFGAMGLDTARDLYALVRQVQPQVVVETGVCNGISSLCLLLGISDNGRGQLYSVDYPYHSDRDLETFRAETFDGYGGAAIPPGKEPGWIVPEDLRAAWALITGKSQRELPRLLTELEQIDLFLHDSEHSFPCMLFEYEIAWAWLRPGGALLSDDIHWNDAFQRFIEARGGEAGRISRSVGYVVKE